MIFCFELQVCIKSEVFYSWFLKKLFLVDERLKTERWLMISSKYLNNFRDPFKDIFHFYNTFEENKQDLKCLTCNQNQYLS
jgi:hypothetical protein